MATNPSEMQDQRREHMASFSRTMPIAIDEIMQAPPCGGMSLTLRKGAGKPPIAIAIDPKTYTIGREETCDIHVSGPSVSRRHARIFFLHDEEIIEDLGSTNGTFVNGVRVTRCVLQDNDIIRVGDNTILFSAVSKTQAPSE